MAMYLCTRWYIIYQRTNTTEQHFSCIYTILFNKQQLKLFAELTMSIRLTRYIPEMTADGKWSAATVSEFSVGHLRRSRIS